ncbi:hypothetical protein LV716_09910 [Flagellimonas sp. HMM57]|uniref:hypothetical protein n=1 Tax=unclassified Flagellimonas TaxID=2644544 RepID=UPI0013D70174|nr:MULTISPECIES: hypothetical protein [unclassified Flagellimonas]UII74583.1 hypothetical protein LV716_09910 [Flagellimonas sp. HMM57]
MKVFKLLLFFFTVISSCNTNDSNGDEDVQVPLKSEAQKWELVKMTGSMVNSETIGDAMEWQEYYLFNPDGSFIKEREREGSITKATGTYELMAQEEERYFELTYKTGTTLIANCSNNDKEILVFNGDALYATWNACDGPGLEYRPAE